MPLGVKRPDRARSTIARPDARLPRAGPDGLQLRHAVVPQRRPRCSARATATAPGSASSSSPRRRAPTTRAARPRRPPTGPTRRQPPAHQPVPEHRVAGPAEGVRGGQRAVPRRPARSSATCPATSAPRPRRRRGSADARPSHADDARVPRKDRTGASPFTVGLIALVVVVHRRLPRLHEGHPVHARLPVKAVVRVGELDPRATRRCGSPASTSARSRRSSAQEGTDAAVVTMEINDNGPADPQGRDGQDPPAHLPRGQLLRRPQAGHAGGADARRRRHDHGHPDGDAGPARPGADLAAERHARGPPGLLDGLGTGAELQADRGATTATPTRRARGETRGASRSTTPTTYGAPRAARHARCQRGAARHRAAATSRG